jgi:fructosamine-3-kinase
VPGPARRPLSEAVRAACGVAVARAARVGGGDINDAYRVELEDGTPAFVKTRPDVAPGEYATEADGLRWLADAGGLPVPEVLGVADDALVLEWVDEGRPGDEAALGRGLARIHAAGAPAFGGPRPLRIGPLELSNEPARDWPAFYGERRLRPLLGALSRDGADKVERVIERLPELAGPEEPPARLHGDLWTGNVLWATDERPWLIDPAAYGGHREVDIAMLKLFGSPGRAFHEAYDEVSPLAHGHEARVVLWQLFPLLVHAALFGGGYAASAERTAEQYL